MLGDKERKAMAEWERQRKEVEKERRANKHCGNCGFFNLKNCECGYWDVVMKDTDTCRKWR